jgi:hypothetical protein
MIMLKIKASSKTTKFACKNKINFKNLMTTFKNILLMEARIKITVMI